MGMAASAIRTPRLPFRPNRIGSAALPTSAVRAKLGPGDLEDVVDEADDDEERQRVEHDRRDHLVGARERLERARDEPVERPAERAGHQRYGDRDGHRLIGDRGADERRDEPADEHLAGPADVEEPGLEPDPDRETGQDQGRGGRDGAGQGARSAVRVDRERKAGHARGVHVEQREPGGALEEALVGDERQEEVQGLADGQARGDDQQRAEQQGQDDRDDRDDGQRPQPTQRRHASPPGPPRG